MLMDHLTKKVKEIKRGTLKDTPFKTKIIILMCILYEYTAAYFVLERFFVGINLHVYIPLPIPGLITLRG